MSMSTFTTRRHKLNEFDFGPGADSGRRRPGNRPHLGFEGFIGRNRPNREADLPPVGNGTIARSADRRQMGRKPIRVATALRKGSWRACLVIDDYPLRKGARPDGRLGLVLRQRPRITGHPFTYPPACKRAIEITVDGFRAGFVVFLTSKLVAETRDGCALEEFHFRPIKYCCAGRVLHPGWTSLSCACARDTALDKAFRSAKAAVEQHFERVRSYRGEDGDRLFLQRETQHLPTDARSCKKTKVLAQPKDTRWRPERCEIAFNRTSPPKKASTQPHANNDHTSPFDYLVRDVQRKKLLPQVEEDTLLNAMRVCRDDPARQADYYAARATLIAAYTPLILKLARKLCKPWMDRLPDLRAEEIVNELTDRLFKKIDKVNPNKGRVATFIMQAVKSSFLDYLRTIRTPGGITSAGKSNLWIDPIDDTIIKHDDETAEVIDEALTREESIEGGNYRDIALVAEIAAVAAEILTPKEHRVIVGLAFEDKSIADLANEMVVTTQRVSALRLKAEIKLKNYYRNKTAKVA
jgi:RNA polymerase sigma factor (sigma-70 family)